MQLFNWETNNLKVESTELPVYDIQFDGDVAIVPSNEQGLASYLIYNYMIKLLNHYKVKGIHDGNNIYTFNTIQSMRAAAFNFSKLSKVTDKLIIIVSDKTLEIKDLSPIISSDNGNKFFICCPNVSDFKDLGKAYTTKLTKGKITIEPLNEIKEDKTDEDNEDTENSNNFTDDSQ